MDTIHASLAFIDGVGTPEMMLIFVIVLVLFGGKKLPEFARGLGKTMREFKKAAAGVEDEFKRALEEDERKSNQAKLAAPSTTPALLPASETPVHDEHGFGHEAGPAASASASTPADSTVATPATTEPVTAAAQSANVTATPDSTAAISARPGGTTLAPVPTPVAPATPKRAQAKTSQLPDYL